MIFNIVTGIWQGDILAPLPFKNEQDMQDTAGEVRASS